MSLREWISKVGVVLRGAKYTTKGHEYLDDIIDDDHPWQVFMKGAQVAMSTTMLIKPLYISEHLGKKPFTIFRMINRFRIFQMTDARQCLMKHLTWRLVSEARTTFL